MARWEIRKIAPGAAFNFVGGVSIFVCIALALASQYTDLPMMRGFVDTLTGQTWYPEILQRPPIPPLIAGTILGLCLGASAFVASLLYNLFASFMGGLRLDLRERPVKKKAK